MKPKLINSKAKPDLVLTGDLHLSDRPKDAYRFGIFKELALLQDRYQPEVLVILGDLTDAKDNHSSNLVNAIVDGLTSLTTMCPVVILKGNHDYIDPSSPFFKFLGELQDVHFINQPTTMELLGKRALFIPHIPFDDQWDSLSTRKPVDFIFAHQTVDGAIAESGRKLTGFSLKPLKALKARRIWSGDIHRPQTVGPDSGPQLTYVGPPYNIRFGDDFRPRILLYDSNLDQEMNHWTDFPRKRTFHISDVDEIEGIKQGDHVKVELELVREEAVEWQTHKKAILERIEDLGGICYGAEVKVNTVTRKVRLSDNKEVSKARTPEQILEAFANREGLSRAQRDQGASLLQER